MTAGAEVVEDYGHVGLTLRSDPVSFLREDLAARRIVTCAEAMAARDGRWLEAAGVVLVRQMPGSAKGVMFITIEDELERPDDSDGAHDAAARRVRRPGRLSIRSLLRPSPDYAAQAGGCGANC